MFIFKVLRIYLSRKGRALAWLIRIEFNEKPLYLCFPMKVSVTQHEPLPEIQRAYLPESLFFRIKL